MKIYIQICLVIFLISCSGKKQIKGIQVNKKPEVNTTKKAQVIPSNKTDYTNFIPKGYTIVDQNIVFGDFNGDSFKDFVAIIADGDLNDLDDDNYPGDVRIVIYEGTKEETYIKNAQSGNMTYAFIYEEGDHIKITKSNIISITHQSMRSDYELKFRFEPGYNTYMLIGAEYSNYGNAYLEGAGEFSTNYLNKTRTIKRRAFNPDKETVIYLPEEKIKLKEDIRAIHQVDGNNIDALVCCG